MNLNHYLYPKPCVNNHITRRSFGRSLRCASFTLHSLVVRCSSCSLDAEAAMDRFEKLALEFCKGKYDYNIEDTFWPKVFDYLRKNASVLSFDREAIHVLWTVNGGHLRRKIKDDNLVLDVLLKFRLLRKIRG